MFENEGTSWAFCCEVAANAPLSSRFYLNIVMQCITLYLLQEYQLGRDMLSVQARHWGATPPQWESSADEVRRTVPESRPQQQDR